MDSSFVQVISFFTKIEKEGKKKFIATVIDRTTHGRARCCDYDSGYRAYSSRFSIFVVVYFDACAVLLLCAHTFFLPNTVDFLRRRQLFSKISPGNRNDRISVFHSALFGEKVNQFLNNEPFVSN